MKRWTLAVWLVVQAGCVNDAMIAVRSDGGSDASNDLGVTPDLPIVGPNDVPTDRPDAAALDAVAVDRPIVVDALTDREDTAAIDVSDVIALDLPDAAPSTLPRQLAPLAGARVTQQRPTLHWAASSRPSSVRVEVCADHACATVEQTWETTGTSGRPTTALTTGVHFWRLSFASGGATSPVWSFVVPPRSGDADTSWNSLTDFNGDGLADLAVLTQGGDAGSNVTVHTYLGRAGDVPAPGPTFAVAGQPWVVALGDLDGDGYGELGVRRVCVDPGTDRIEIHRGGPTGPSPDAAETILWRDVSCELGRPFVGVGDVNGDGYGDVLADTGVLGLRGGGFGYRVELYLGAAVGQPLTLSTDLEGGTEYNAFGSPTALGDVNGDGFADVATIRQAGSFHGGGAIPGIVFIHLGGAASLDPTASATIVGPTTGDLPHWTLANAPFDGDGDGFADVLVGDGPMSGTPWRFDLYAGSRLETVTASSTAFLPTPLTGDLYGALSYSPGDFDRDGRSDIAVLATQRGSVSVQLFHGGEGPTDGGVPARFVLADRALASAQASDLDGDGRDDLVVSLGSPGADAPTTAQSVEFLRGGAWPIGETSAVFLHNPDGESMTLGR